MALRPPLSPLTHHRDNVTAPHGRPNLRSRLHSCHAQEGGPRSPQRTCGGTGEEKKKKEKKKLKAYEQCSFRYSILLTNIPKIIMSANSHLKMSIAEFTIVTIPSDRVF